jgi:glycerol uptake facilitator-like aquaporin
MLLLAGFGLSLCHGAGGHFNSLITLASLSTGHIFIVRGLLYIGFQVLGWYIGAEIMRASIDEALAISVGLGTCNPGNKSYEQAFAIEFMCCLLLIFPVYGTAFNLRQREVFGPIYPPLLIGATLALLIFGGFSLGTAPFTGAGMNPSLCSGTALSLANIQGMDSTAIFKHHSVYWVAPIFMAVCHSVLYTLMPPHHETILAPMKM